MPDKREPKFKAGDVVRHRASLRRAVVLRPRKEWLTRHGLPVSFTNRETALRDSEGSDHVFQGWYELTEDFGDKAVEKTLYCHEDSLEAAP